MTASVPIFSGPECVATLRSGGVIARTSRSACWKEISPLLTNCSSAELHRIREAHQKLPQVQEHRVHAAGRLLDFFARTLEAQMPGWLLSVGHDDPLAVAKAKEYIGQHLGETIRLADLARHAGVCAQHLCELFKANGGLTFKQFVALARTEKAKALLRDPSLRITEVAFESGFKSLPTFNRVFKRLVGKPPKAYRAEF
jgi:AraC-like DNA-binding protein